MNVIIVNKNASLIDAQNIDILERIEGVFSIESIAQKYKNFYYNKMIIDITAIEDYENINVIQKISLLLDVSKIILLLDDSNIVSSPSYLSSLVSMGIYNFTKNASSIPFLINNPNTYKDVANYHNLNKVYEEPKLNDQAKNDNVGFIGRRIIGIKNITLHAGATTLTYLLKKHLEKEYKVKAVEIDKNDFMYFNDRNLDSNVDGYDIDKYLSQNNNESTEVILIDVNDSDVESYCTDMLYLIEPGLIQLNRLIRNDRMIFSKLKGKKIVLNRSILNNSDVSDFEKESGSKIFYNMPNVDDKLDDNKAINKLLIDLGFTRINENGTSRLSLFH